MTAPDTSAPAVAAMIERLTPDWVDYDPTGIARRYLKRVGQTEMSEFLTDAVIENNILKAEAASMLSELMRERDEERGKAMEEVAVMLIDTWSQDMSLPEALDSIRNLAALSNPNQETK